MGESDVISDVISLEDDMKRRDYYIDMVVEETGLSREWVEREMDYAKENGIKYKVYAVKGYWAIPHDQLVETHRTGSHRRHVAREIAALRGRDRHEVEKEMLYAKYTYGLRVGYFKKYDWDLLTDEEKSRMLLRPHSELMSNKYQLPDADIEFLDSKERFYTAFPDVIGRKWFHYDVDMSEKEFKKGLASFDSAEIIIKPEVSSGGKGILKAGISQGAHEIWNMILEAAKEDENLRCGVVEECLLQHEEMKKLCPDSINTVRLVTLYWCGKYKLLYAACRMGAGDGKPVDNVSQGGLAIGVDAESGVFNTVAADKDGEPVAVHPGSGIELKGFQIPYWKEILALVKNSSIKIFETAGLGYVGWDVAVTPNGPVIVEGNNWPSPSLVQLCNWLDSRKGMKYLFEPYL